MSAHTHTHVYTHMCVCARTLVFLFWLISLFLIFRQFSFSCYFSFLLSSLNSFRLWNIWLVSYCWFLSCLVSKNAFDVIVSIFLLLFLLRLLCFPFFLVLFLSFCVTLCLSHFSMTLSFLFLFLTLWGI